MRRDREQKARLKTLAARRRELEDIQYEFKKQGFDNPRSTFREDKLVGDLLNDFLRGGITAADLLGPVAAQPELARRRLQTRQQAVAATDDDDDDRRGAGSPAVASAGRTSSFGGGASAAVAIGFGGSWGRLPGWRRRVGRRWSAVAAASRGRAPAPAAPAPGGFKTGGGF